MNVSQLTEVSYTGAVIAGIICFLVLLTLTLLGYFHDYNRLRDGFKEKSFFNTPSRIASHWVGFFVITSALAFGALWAVSQQGNHKMDQERVADWVGVEYGIDDITFSKENGIQKTDQDNDVKSEEIMTGVMDGQRISFYIHELPNGSVYPMILDREIPKLYVPGESAEDDSSGKKD